MEPTQTFSLFYKQHLEARNTSLRKLKLPYPSLRAGQLALMREITESICAGENFLLNAPTGFGKTLTTVIPALACLGKGFCEKIFYCTAKESTRTLPEDLLSELSKAGSLQLWSLTLYAQEKLCPFHEFCRHIFKKSFIVEIAELLIQEKLIFAKHITADLLLQTAEEFNICPYLLMLQLAVYADFVILDYNYVCDPLQQLHFFKQDKRYVLLCDEAHNLVSRGQNIFSSSIDVHVLRELKRYLQTNRLTFSPAAANLQEQVENLLLPLERLGRLLLKLRRVQDGEIRKDLLKNFFSEQRYWVNEHTSKGKTSTAVKAVDEEVEEAVAGADAAEAATFAKLTYEDIFYADMEQGVELFIKAEITYLAVLCHNLKSAWHNFYHEYGHKLSLEASQIKHLTRFMRNLERCSYLIQNCWQKSSILHFKLKSEASSRASGSDKQSDKGSFQLLCELHNLDCSTLISSALPAESSIIFFSATLLPLEYFRKMLTASAGRVKMRSTTSAFLNENRNVAVLAYLDLEYRKRSYSLAAVAQALATYMRLRGGHLLVFAPSYVYAQQLAPYLQTLLPQDCLFMAQTRRHAKERDNEILKKLKQEQERNMLVLAVLQGAFSEGLDLPGAAVTGVAVISAAFPTKSNLHELTRLYYDQNWNVYQDERNVGYLYTDLYPGFTKILQACGRLIRSESDFGDILLIDSRFEREEYKSLLTDAFERYALLDSQTALESWLQALPPLDF